MGSFSRRHWHPFSRQAGGPACTSPQGTFMCNSPPLASSSPPPHSFHQVRSNENRPLFEKLCLFAPWRGCTIRSTWLVPRLFPPPAEQCVKRLSEAQRTSLPFLFWITREQGIPLRILYNTVIVEVEAPSPGFTGLTRACQSSSRLHPNYY